MNKRLIIFDVDGTLCDITHRLHLIQGDRKDWDKFFIECVKDEPKEDIIALVHMLQTFCDIKLFSGRSDAVRKETTDWLKIHLHLEKIDLTMRKEGDHRPDYLVKQEMYQQLDDHDKDRLLCVFDDRDQVVRMWRDQDVTCLQVNYGNF